MASPWTSEKIHALLNLTFSEEETVQQLQQLAPNTVSAELFQFFLESMASFCKPLPNFSNFELMDCCGTGGSGKSFFNTSTAMAFVLAAGGLSVLKFGNRAISSTSGSFDFLESLGIPSHFPVEKIPNVLERSGLAFLFAPECYPQLAGFNRIRKQLKQKTIFNFMGPLLNPTQPAYRVIGVSDPTMLQHLHTAMTATPVYSFFERNRRTVFVHSKNSLLDEFSCVPEDTPELKEVHSLEVTSLLKSLTLSSEALFSTPNSVYRSVENAPKDWYSFLTQQAKYRTAQDNVETFLRLINTTQDTRFQLSWMDRFIFDSLVLNAGAGLWVAGKAPSIDEGIALATDLMFSGKVRNTVDTCRRAYQDHA
jgi:anthranilate phosphoribosyltransferase